MIKDVLQNIGGIGLYGVISICLFFVVFSAMLVWASRLRKPFLNSMSLLPLENEPAPKTTPKSTPSPVAHPTKTSNV